MKRLAKILVPTDLSEHSRRALLYGCWLAGEEKASLIVLHVARAWEHYAEDLTFLDHSRKSWPADRVVAEATLDLNRFLEPSAARLKKLSSVTKRVVLGPVPQRIASVAAEERADSVIMAPRRPRGIKHLLFGGITEHVTRLSPCPIVSIVPPRSEAPILVYLDYLLPIR
jgi:nucleotide-binding universal stress UspA family protein